MRRFDWVPPLAWMAVILALSTDVGSAEQTGSFLLPALRWIWPTATAPLVDAAHAVIRKLAHLTEYGVLAALWYRALIAGRRRSPATAVVIAVALSALWACIDEAFQRLTPSRTPSLVDVAIDATGALIASVGATGWPRLAELITSTLLWAATIVGCVVLIINALAGVGSGALWVTTSAAALAVAARRRRSLTG